jgi:hypothetical protein
VNCSSCNRQIAPVTIGTGAYCPACGARIEPEGAVVAIVSPIVKSMDIQLARRLPASTTQTATRVQPAAQALHQRTKPSSGQVIDLRAAKRPVPTTPMAAVITPDAPKHQIARHTAAPLVKPATRRTAVVSTERLERAQSTPMAETISRFHRRHNVPSDAAIRSSDKTAIGASDAVPARAVTQHEALTKILATTPAEPVDTLRTSNRGKLAAGIAAVAILAGYVWVQNYPKLAIASAGNQAGISASLPGYVPSSYSLATTTTAPGIVTLQFASPNQSEPLTITQHRTAWDSSSLVDNYVSKVATDYSSIEGQGLTVYLFDQNNASWVNHGLWYSIAGTARLSRAQILKIAYSL